MNNDEKRYDLIGRLIIWLIDDPSTLRLESTVLPRRINWAAKVGINDTGKLIGKQGAHLDAIRILVALMGLRFGEEWRFAVLDPDDAPRAQPRRIPANPDYEPGDAQNFLHEIVDSFLESPVTIATTHDNALNEYTFTIQAGGLRDYERLVTSIPSGRDKITPVAAIGTLFRAYGRQKGVNFRIEVPGR